MNDVVIVDVTRTYVVRGPNEAINKRTLLITLITIIYSCTYDSEFSLDAVKSVSFDWLCSNNIGAIMIDNGTIV